MQFDVFFTGDLRVVHHLVDDDNGNPWSGIAGSERFAGLRGKRLAPVTGNVPSKANVAIAASELEAMTITGEIAGRVPGEQIASLAIGIEAHSRSVLRLVQDEISVGGYDGAGRNLVSVREVTLVGEPPATQVHGCCIGV